jgi:alkylhydroperoxidase family enzyme
VLPPDWDEGTLDALSTFPSARDFLLAQWRSGERNIAGLNLMGALLHHPALCKAFLAFEAHVFRASSLPFRIRELLILRISCLQRSVYEFAQHLSQGRKAGLSDAELERIPLGAQAAGWDDADADLLRAVDELHREARIADATWTRLAQRFDTAQMLDLVFLVGCFGSLCAFANSVNVELEPGIEPTPWDDRMR